MAKEKERKRERERETCATIIDCEGKSIVPQRFFYVLSVSFFFLTRNNTCITTSSSELASFVATVLRGSD